MKQNLKKINIYSNLLNDAVNTFDDFNSGNSGLENFCIALKRDLAINTFFKSKTVEVFEKIVTRTLYGIINASRNSA